MTTIADLRSDPKNRRKLAMGAIPLFLASRRTEVEPAFRFAKTARPNCELLVTDWTGDGYAGFVMGMGTIQRAEEARTARIRKPFAAVPAGHIGRDRRAPVQLSVALGTEGYAVGNVIAQFGSIGPRLDMVGIYPNTARATFLACIAVSLEHGITPLDIWIARAADIARALLSFVGGMGRPFLKVWGGLPYGVFRPLCNAGHDARARIGVGPGSAYTHALGGAGMGRGISTGARAVFAALADLAGVGIKCLTTTEAC